MTQMVEIKRFVSNCKPRSNFFVKERISELSGSLDEMLEPSPSQRKTSYDEALHMIKQFTRLIKDCNYQISPDN